MEVVVVVGVDRLEGAFRVHLPRTNDEVVDDGPDRLVRSM